MNRNDIALIRLASQQLAGTTFSQPRDIVTWMVAMQAQDFPMAKWAIGARLPGSTDNKIEAAMNNASILRTHLLRPTWHFVAAEDIYWLIDLSGGQIKASQRSRDRQLELSEAIYTKSNTIIEKALSLGAQLTREELLSELNRANIATHQNRSAHLLERAELEKIICSGTNRNGKPTYALFSEKVRHTRKLNRDEALAELARRYFTSRCPATLQDFSWWSGLPIGDARRGLELVKTDFNPEMIDGQTYWFTPGFTIPQSSQASVFLLPTYDEFMISYADRSASIPIELEQQLKQISDRGVFRPVIVVNGQVTGIWKRTIKNQQVLLKLKYFTQPGEQSFQRIDEAIQRYGFFAGLQAIVQM